MLTFQIQKESIAHSPFPFELSGVELNAFKWCWYSIRNIRLACLWNWVLSSCRYRIVSRGQPNNNNICTYTDMVACTHVHSRRLHLLFQRTRFSSTIRIYLYMLIICFFDVLCIVNYFRVPLFVQCQLWFMIKNEFDLSVYLLAICTPIRWTAHLYTTSELSTA